MLGSCYRSLWLHTSRLNWDGMLGVYRIFSYFMFFFQSWHEDLFNKNYSRAKLISSIEKFSVEHFYNPKIEKGLMQDYQLADQFAVAVLLNPEIVTESKNVYTTVECTGEFTRGQMIVDWHSKSNREPNVNLVLKVDKTKVGEILRRALFK